MAKNTKPAIRFKGFTDAWEQRKVTELGKIYIGLVTTMTKHYTEEGTLLIRNSDIKDGRFEFGDEPIYLETSFAEENSSRMHKLGDVITVHTGDVGTSAVITENEINSIGFATIVTCTNQQIIYSEYLCTFLNTEKHKRWAVAISTGDGRTNYNLGDYFELVVPVPKLDEQKKVACFIKELNHLITLHQRKYDSLVNVKKAMLEKMFPKNGETVPEIRFKGFTDAWEQRKFGDIATRSSIMTSEKELPRVEYEDIITEAGELNKDLYSKGNEKMGLKFSSGDVLYGKLRPYLHNWLLPTFDGVAVGDFWVLQPQNIDSSFLFRLIQGSKFDEIANQSTGTKMPRADWKLIAKTEFSVPVDIEEQKYIGSYFQRLDNLITLHQRKLEKLKNIKKSCLEKMFV